MQRIARSGGRDLASAIAGRTLKLIGVLKGSVFFLTALARHIEVPVKIDFLAISSFSNKSGSPGVVRIAKDLDESIEGEDVLLVEDIVDTGFTLRYLLQTLAGRGAEFALASARSSTATRAASCRCRWTSAASKSPTASWSASAWITTSSTATWDTWR